MICNKCGNKMPENVKFCVKCGAKADKEGSVKEYKPKNTKVRLFLLLLGFILILGILTGAGTGYYVAKNGWETVPFAEKLSFLSIVKFDKEKMETYSDSIDVEVYEDMEKEDTSIEENINGTGGDIDAVIN